MNINSDFSKMMKIVSILGALAVIFGAFGAHGLKPLLSNTQLSAYQTGISYQFYHVLAMMGATIFYKEKGQSHFKKSFYLFGLGILFFSGSLYLLSTQDILGVNLSFLGPVTPIGGLLFIAGWLYLFLGSSKKHI